MKELLSVILEKTTFEKFMDGVVDLVVTLFLGILAIICVLVLA